MPNEPITEAQARERERKAFMLGVGASRYHQTYAGQRADANTIAYFATGWAEGASQSILDAAALLFPPPKRMRVVADPHEKDTKWRCRGGTFEWLAQHTKDSWHYGMPTGTVPTPERAAMWVDLATNPTEDDA